MIQVLFSLLIGAILGLWWFHEGHGCVIGAILGWLCLMTFKNHRHLQRLKQQIHDMEAGATTPEQGLPVTQEIELAAQTALPLAAEELPPSPPAAPSLWQLQVKKFFTQGNLVLRIGLLILFFGVSFLLKYAVDHDIISIELRLIFVALAAMLLLAWGWHERQQRPDFALLAQGGGVGILFLTVFAAYKLYGLLPLPLTFTLMLGLVATSTALALLQDARSLALFGAIGAFSAPLLLSSNSGNHLALFSYYAILNSGLLVIAWFRAWRELNLLGFLCTFGIGGLWGARAYQPEHFLAAEFFLILFFLLFTGMGILFAFRQPPKLRGYVDGTLVFGTPLVFFFFQAFLVKQQPYALAFTALLLSFLYTGLALALWHKGKGVQGLRTLTEVLLTLGLIFITVAIPLALSGKWVAIIWVIKGAALLWLGLRHRQRGTRWFGLGLQLAAGYFFLTGNHAAEQDSFILNGYYLGAACLALAAFFSALHLYKNTEHLAPFEKKFHPLLFIWASLWWFAAGIREISLHVPYHCEDVACLLFLGLSCTLLMHLAGRFTWPIAAWPTLFLLPLISLIAFGKIGCYTFHHGEHLFAHGGWVAWPLIFILLWYNLFLGRKYLAPSPLAHTHLGAFLLLALLLSVEAAWFVQQLVPPRTSWNLLPWAVVPAALLGLVQQRHLAARWPLSEYASVYQQQGAGLLVLGLWLWLLLSALGNAGHAPPLPFIPLINPLELSQLAVILFLLHWLYVQHRQEASCVASLPQHGLIFLVVGSILLWLNSVLARAVHHWGELPFHFSALWASQVYQTALSLLWALLALSLMILADRWKNRSLWFTGSILIAITVLKLFLMDLANTGTVERIVSFLAVGCILLLIGYFNPLPPVDKQEKGL